MSFFFPRTVYQTEAAFTPLFRILDDIERSSSPSCPPRASRHRGQGGCHGAYRQSHRQVFNPRFDIREVDDAYVLTGELPGLSREQVAVEFPEPRTLTVRGSLEKPAAEPQQQQQKIVASETSSSDEATVTEDNSSRMSYQASVEDDGDNFEVIDNPTAEKQHLLDQQEPAAAPAPATEKQDEQPQQEQEQEPAELNHFWLKERRAGDFSRSFRFASYVDHDGVTASLENGVLTVVVPKAPKPKTHRVTID